MSIKYEIPLSATPQTFNITLAGTSYQLTFYWNIPGTCWVVDIDNSSGINLVKGIPLVTGADLLEQYGYLNFGGQLIAETDHNITLPPTFSNLGTLGHVYFIVL